LEIQIPIWIELIDDAAEKKRGKEAWSRSIEKVDMERDHVVIRHEDGDYEKPGLQFQRHPGKV
jgi:hypothetical protein